MVSILQKQIAPGEAHLITNHHNIEYLSGFTGSNGTILLTRTKTYLFTDFRYERVAQKVTKKGIKPIINGPILAEIQKILSKHKIKQVLFEESDVSVAKLKLLKKVLKGIKLSPGKLFVEQFRMSKKNEEIRHIIKAQRIAENTYKKVVQKLRIGMSEAAVAWEIEKIGHELGADTISFPSIVAFGSNSGSPHHQSGSRKLKKGDIVLIDMGMKYKGYCSDMTRTAFTKPPTKLQEKVYLTVLQAQTEAEKHVATGAVGSKVDKVARNIIKEAGYGDRFGHSLGHGIGLEVHEAPNLAQGYNKPLPDNTIVTVEPGIYLEKSFGVRIEDMVLVKGKKAVNLTKSTKDLKRLVLTIHNK